MKEKHTNKFGMSVIYDSTWAYKNFSDEQVSSEMLLLYLILNNQNMVDNKKGTKQSLIDLYSDPENSVAQKTVDFFKSEHSDALFDIFFYEQHLGRMIYIRAIDNFINYLKDVLADIVLEKPEVLKSNETETVEFILSHNTLEDLVFAISEKRIERLFYRGIEDIQQFFEKRCGIQIFKDDETKNSINLLIKQRNLAVHNRGIVSKELVESFPGNDFVEGNVLNFKYPYVSKINAFLNNFVIDLDIELSDKFGLEIVKV